MSFSICILSFNHPQLTARTIRSCLQYSSDSNICLLHNGSLAKNRKILEEEFPEIQHWVLPENRGYTGGVNEILRRSLLLHDWAFVLTNDCELKSKIYLPSTPGLYGPTIWRRKLGRVDSLLGKVSFRSGQLSHLHTPADIEALNSAERLYVPGTAFLIHKNIFNTVGLLDEDLGTYWEDVDYSLRAQNLGFKLGLQSSIEVLHGVGKTCHKDPYYTTYLYQRNRRRICLKHCPKEFRNLLLFNFWLEKSKRLFRDFFQRDQADLRRSLYKRALQDV